MAIEILKYKQTTIPNKPCFTVHGCLVFLDMLGLKNNDNAIWHLSLIKQI